MSNLSREYLGGCHCRSAAFSFVSANPLVVRECQCSFCRKHGARNVSDPNGKARITSTVPLARYHFGLGMTDFLLCPRCGCYIAAVMRDGSDWRSTFNLNCFDNPHIELNAEPMVYEGEDSEQRLNRRLAKWTPTIIDETEPPAPGRT